MRIISMRYVLSRDAYYGREHAIYRAAKSWFWTPLKRNAPEGPFRTVRDAARDLCRKQEWHDGTSTT